MAKRPALLCACSGVLLWTGFPGPGLWWLTPWIALVPLFFAVPHLSARRAALAAWQAGCFCCGLTLLWLLGLIPIAGTIAVLGFGLLVPWLGAGWIVNALLARWVIRRRPAALLLVAPAAWAGTEWLQNHLFTGFGWVFVGYTQSTNTPLLQLASVGGVYAVTWVVVLVNACIWFALRPGAPTWRLASALGAVAVVAATHGWGHARLTPPSDESLMTVGIVQGSFATEVKWDNRYAEVMWAQQVKQTYRAADAGAEVVIWSEAALGLHTYHWYEARLKSLAREINMPIVLGSNFYHLDADGYVQRVTNAVMAVHPDGTEEGPYDKQHLTPFGEYTPLKWLFPFLDKMIPAISDFDTGTENLALQLNGARAQPLICFESVFPHEVRAAVRDSDPDVLLHLTNVGWFGRSIMPEQDLAVSRFRAVELGVPMVRAANVGISCILDAHGRLRAVADSEWGRVFIEKTVVAPLPAERVPTLYRRYGDAFILLCIVLVLAGVRLCYTRAPRPS